MLSQDDLPRCQECSSDLVRTRHLGHQGLLLSSSGDTGHPAPGPAHLCSRAPERRWGTKEGGDGQQAKAAKQLPTPFLVSRRAWHEELGKGFRARCITQRVSASPRPTCHASRGCGDTQRAPSPCCSSIKHIQKEEAGYPASHEESWCSSIAPVSGAPGM